MERPLKSLRIGCGAGFWGDSAEGPAQLVRRGEIDVLVLDYLAEITMSILARMKQKNPALGYATDFIEAVMAPLAKEIAEKRIRVVTNAGGVNPLACAAALEKLGVPLKIAVVTGDDVMGNLPPGLPAAPLSANAYLGAAPIAEAWRRGADVIITGRCVDSALALGPLMATFDWAPTDYDRLAAGSLAGHVIECGAQATGGIVTDWEDVAAGWSEMGFPVVECFADGRFDLTKPLGTGGKITPATTAEQIVYEVHDPARYLLPDVTCDFTHVRVSQVGPDRVSVVGARGTAPPSTLKASITYADGYRASATLMIVGHDARSRAKRVGEAILARVERIAGHAFARKNVEVLGAESYFGPNAKAAATREVILAVAVADADRAAVETFTREIAPAATAMAQSITGFAAGRPSVAPVIRLASALLERDAVTPMVNFAGEIIAVPALVDMSTNAPAAAEVDMSTKAAGDAGATKAVPLRVVARARSGDKGDTANIGVLARSPALVPVLRAHLTAEAVRGWLAHLVDGDVTRYEWPGLDGFNFVLERVLGGGGIASLRHDPQGKALAQILLEMPIAVPTSLLPAGWT